MAFGYAAAIGGVASLAGAYLSSNAAKDAAKTQSAAASAASNQTQGNYQQTRADLSPFVGGGVDSLLHLRGQMPQLTQQFAPTQANLESTPGYQFTRDQGLQAVQNAASAKGLGISGAALKGAANYATGLADNTYQTQFNIDQANKTNAYNKLLGLTNMGASAANQTGGFGQAANAASTNALMTGASATAAGDVGSANAINSGVNGASNAYMQYALLNRLMPQGGAGAAGAGTGKGFS